jgi:hypothetical protein
MPGLHLPRCAGSDEFVHVGARRGLALRCGAEGHCALAAAVDEGLAAVGAAAPEEAAEEGLAGPWVGREGAGGVRGAGGPTEAGDGRETG